MAIVDNDRPPCIAYVVQKQRTDENNLLTSPNVGYFNSDTLAVCQEKAQE
ncbi:hypothetical protein [Spiroplasma kunkelii]|nr:hypothetical protein [Spiroplasma kunkelii]